MACSRSPWFLRLSATPDPGLRVVAFPFAGGGASMFRRWVRELPPTIDMVGVQLPGRENRSREVPVRDLRTLVNTVTEELRATFADGCPFVLFGHSLGALIAFEVARQVRRVDGPSPQALVVSGRTPPQLASGQPRHGLTDEDLISDLRRLDGIPAEIMENREFLNLALPVLRADLFLDETYVYEPEPPLDCPIVALGGSDDPEVAEHELKEWAAHTRSRFSMRVFPGGHFFLQARPDLFVSALTGYFESVTAFR